MVIALRCDEPNAIRMMVDYLYQSDYTASMESPLTIHAHTFALGFKYAIPGLRRVAVVTFREQMQEAFDADDFVAAAEVALVRTPYAKTDPALAEVVLLGIANNPTILDRESCRRFLARNKLSFDLVEQYDVNLKLNGRT
jgi:hypothetical protein